MWGSLLAGILARPWVRKAAGFSLVGLTIALFLLNLRRTGERAGRAAGRLENLGRNDAIHCQMLDAAANRPRDRDALVDRLRGGEFKRPARRLSAHGGVQRGRTGTRGGRGGSAAGGRGDLGLAGGLCGAARPGAGLHSSMKWNPRSELWCGRPVAAIIGR